MVASLSSKRPVAPNPSGKKIIAQIKQANIWEIVAVPDIVTSDGLLWPISQDPEFRLTRICKEDEGVSICGAMSYNNTRALLLMQQTGLMDSLNSIRAIGIDYALPIIMMVGLQGKEPNVRLADSLVYGVRIIRPILDAMELAYSLIEDPGDEFYIKDVIDKAYHLSNPHVFLIPSSPEKL